MFIIIPTQVKYKGEIIPPYTKFNCDSPDAKKFLSLGAWVVNEEQEKEKVNHAKKTRKLKKTKV